MSKRLVVLIPDRLSVLIKKGEVVPRYYNPGNVFDEVHIMMTNDDKPDVADVQVMVGDAKLFLHNIIQPKHFFRKTLGWQFWLMHNWVEDIVDRIAALQPDLIRTHNNFLEGYIAARTKARCKVPYVTSLHGIWDVDELTTFKARLQRFFRKKIERATLSNADGTLCVYSPIMDYAKRYGSKSLHLIPNFVGGDYIKPKTSWSMGQPIRLITVNRQQQEKNPENIIRALTLLPYDFAYTIIGDGVLHDYLQDLARTLRLDKKITFIKSLPNEQVCALYAEHDFMVSNCHYRGISKTIIEAGLTGLPTIINKYADGFKLAEYAGDWLVECEDSPQGYAIALQQLILDNQARSEMARRAIAITRQHFLPEELESRVAAIYSHLVHA